MTNAPHRDTRSQTRDDPPTPLIGNLYAAAQAIGTALKSPDPAISMRMRMRFRLMVISAGSSDDLSVAGRAGSAGYSSGMVLGVDSRSSQLAAELIGRAHGEISARAVPNRFVDLLEAGGVPRERLTWLAGEQFRIVGSDQRSFALLAARFPEPPAGEMFLSLAQGELHALGLLSDFAAALGWGERDLRAYEPRPLAQAYPAYLAWSALFGTSSAVALAMLANLQEWGDYCGRVAEALLARYGMPEQATGFFRFFAESPPGFAGQAASVVAAGLAAGEDPQEALRAALALHAYEIAFWDALADGLG